MNNNFINRKDRIIASAIEIISEAGIASLTTKTLAMKENMSESLLYRYFGGIEEVLVEVIGIFTKYDERIIATIEGKDMPHLDKALELIKMLATNYTGYPELAAIALNYEVFLHNVNTREMIADCLVKRRNFIVREFQMAIDAGEIRNDFTAEELADIVLGTLNRDLLNRRLKNDNITHEQVSQTLGVKFIKFLKEKIN
ncbi:MAG: TetR/AcrR family transcriptional regulator [Lachnospiraceae bacterium]|nr:TetR/AcrR family transcriptional regulator [Lachnospiraceae bacterium]